MDKAACARKVYDGMVLEIITSRGDDEVFTSLDYNRQIKIAAVLIARNPLFPVSDDFFHVLEQAGITLEMMQGFGFIGSVVDSPAINVQVVKAAGGNSPGPGPAP